MDCPELLNSLGKSLSKYQYVKVDQSEIAELNFLTVFRTKTRVGFKVLCVVVELLENSTNATDFVTYFNSVRDTLIKKYAEFPYFRELGTFVIVLCKEKEFTILNARINTFKDRTGFHANAMLGTMLINTDKLVFSDCLTWGLFETGKHFETIRETVEEWILFKKLTIKPNK